MNNQLNNFRRSYTLLLFFAFLTNSLLFGQNSSNYKLLWKIEGKDLTEPSFLFGTMHVEDARAFQFSDAVLPALERCKTFALEVQPDSLIFAYTHKKSDISAEEQFKSILTDEEYERLVNRYFEVNGYSFEGSEIDDPNTILSQLIPIIEKSDDKSVFVDLFLLGHAKTMQKNIAGLENLETQLNHFENLSKAQKKNFIMEQLEYSIDEQKHLIDNLTEIYREGDINKIEETVALNGGFDLEMTERNKVMAKSIIRLMHQNSLFSAIGTAHLPGKDGVISLLQKEGYKVTPVEADFTGVADTYEIDESKMKWHKFEDTDLGYSVETPQTPNFSQEFPQYTLHLYHGMSTKISYMYMAYDLRNSPEKDIDKIFAERFMSTMAQSFDGTLVNQVNKPIDGGILYSGMVECANDKRFKLHCFVKEKICYYLAVEMDKSQVGNKSVARFFNSLKVTKAKEKKPNVWMTYKNENGAFSVDVPGEPNDISKVIPNPEDLESDPYYMHLYTVNDEKNSSFYLIRYNDMPNGYYLQDKEAAFSSFLNNLDGKAVLIQEPQVIELDGHDGREIEVKLQGKYHALIRIYIRGNRIHLIMEQKVNETDKVSTDDAFFKSFKFEDYKYPKTKIYTPDDHSFEVTFFEKIKTNLDTIGYEYSPIKNSMNHYAMNTNSGSLFQVSHGQLQDYFKIKDLTEFYNKHFENYTGWNDSIISQKEIKMDNKPAMQYLIMNPNSNAVERHQMLLDNDRLYVMTAYLSNEELNLPFTDSIFKSFRINPSYSKPFDWYASKTDVLLRDLQSKDSLTITRALGAFEYYDFEAVDLPKLYQSLKTTYNDTLYANPVRKEIIHVFTELSDDKTLENLKELYQSSEDNDELKTFILSTIPSIKDNRALVYYKELLEQSPPKSLDAYEWSVLSPFRDSLQFAIDNYKLLLSLTEYDHYRSSVLNISSDLIEKHKDKKNMVLEAQNTLLKFAKQDLETYFENAKDTLNNHYEYYSLMRAYLSFFNQTAINTPVSDEFTSAIIKNEKDNTWSITQALTVRLRSQQEIDKKRVNSLLDSINYRYDIMKAYHDIHQLKKLPKKYLKTDSFAELSLFQFLSNDDYEPDTLELLGKVNKNNQEYYAFSTAYEYDSNQYLAIVGPIKTLSENEELNLYDVYTDWTVLDRGQWKSQTLELISDNTETEK